MTYSKESQELEFAFKVRRALTESSESLPEPTLDRLAQARKLALARKKPDAPSAVTNKGLVLAGNSGMNLSSPLSLLGKFGIVLPLLLLITGLIGVYHYEQEASINDLADIDTAVLVDELPPSAYVDTGFSNYLNKPEE